MARRAKSEGQRWLAEQALPARRNHMRMVGLGLLGTVAAVGQAWCIARLLAPALGGTDANWVAWASLFGVCAVGRGVLAYVMERLGFEAGAAARRRLRTALFVGLFSGGPVETSRISPGVLSALAIDHIEALDGYFGRWLPAASLAIGGPALVMVAVGIVDPFAALVLGIAGLLVPVGMAVAGIGAAKASRGQFVAMGRLQARFLDRVRGIATIVLAGQAEAEAARLEVAATELSRRTMRVLRVAFLSSAALDVAAVGALILLAVRFAGAERSGVIADPAAAVFPLLLVAEFFAPLRAFAAAYQDRMHANEAASQLAAASLTPVVTGLPPAVRTVNANGITIAFEHVSLTRDAARGTVLHDLSFRVPPGETAILVGPSGAGENDRDRVAPRLPTAGPGPDHA